MSKNVNNDVTMNPPIHHEKKKSISNESFKTGQETKQGKTQL